MTGLLPGVVLAAEGVVVLVAAGLGGLVTGAAAVAVIIGEIGDVTRFKNAGQLCSWAGLIPGQRP